MNELTARRMAAGRSYTVPCHKCSEAIDPARCEKVCAGCGAEIVVALLTCQRCGVILNLNERSPCDECRAERSGRTDFHPDRIEFERGNIGAAPGDVVHTWRIFEGKDLIGGGATGERQALAVLLAFLHAEDVWEVFDAHYRNSPGERVVSLTMETEAGV